MTYDPWQVTYFLSTLAGLVSGEIITETLNKSEPFDKAIAEAQAAAQATLSNDLITKLAATLAEPAVQADIGSDWTVVWGPSLTVLAPLSLDWKSGIATFAAANSAYMVHSPSQGRYVIGIAGTNPVSWFDWLFEDLFLLPGATWQSALQAWNLSGKPVLPTSPTDPNLTSGTFLGVLTVLGLQDPKTQATLRSFLGSLQIQATDTVTVTGHSLGGALSPTLALALIDPLGPLSHFSKSQVLAYPTAGPTPGNQAFATRYLEYLPASIGQHPWQVWNADLWNTYDVVPRAWGVDTLRELPALYALSGEYDASTIALIALVISAAEQHSDAFAKTCGTPGRLDTASIAGNFHTSVLPKDAFGYEYDPPSGPVEYLTIPQAKARGIPTSDLKPLPWLYQVAYQHIDAYLQFILPSASPQPQARILRVAEAVRRLAAG
jgi:hypothetical protein